MKVKNQICTECNQVFRFKDETEILSWCPRCFRQAIKGEVRFIPKPLIELDENGLDTASTV